MLQQRFNPVVSSLLLLLMVLIVTAVWYAAYRADSIGNSWAASRYADY